MPEFRKYEVGSEGEVILEKESIGRGQFGEVFKARWNQPYQNTLKEITVAVKTTKGMQAYIQDILSPLKRRNV